MKKRTINSNTLLWIAIIILPAIQGCAIFKDAKKCSTCFSVFNATYEPWVAGVYQGGSGTDFRFTLIANCKTTVKFDSIWVENTRLNVSPIVGNKVVKTEIQLNKGDTLLVKSSLTKNHSQNLIKITPPVPLNPNQAVIRCFKNGKMGLIKIDAMERIRGIPRP